MKYLFFAILSIASLFAYTGGGYVGNGGDILRCKQNPNSPFNGYYVLDYVATFNYSNQNSDLILADPHPLQSIIKNMKQKIPALGLSLQSFTDDMNAQFLSAPDYSRSHIWIGQRLGLNDLQDEFLAQVIPENCYQNIKQKKLDLTQAILREERPESTLYRYDDVQIPELKRQSELQFSFLVVHEWLWNYTANANIIRDANRFLHMSSISQKSPEEISRALRSLGVEIDRPIKTKTIDISIESCDPRRMSVTQIDVPTSVKIKINFHNRSRCGFSLFESQNRGAIAIIDAPSADEGQTTLMIMPPFQITLQLLSTYRDVADIPFDERFPPSKMILKATLNDTR